MRKYLHTLLVIVLFTNINSSCNFKKAAPTANGMNSDSSLRMLVGTYTNGTGSQGAYLFEFDQEDATYSLLDTAAAINPSFIIPSADRKHAWSVGETDDGTQRVYSYLLGDKTLDIQSFSSTDGENSGASPCNIVIYKGNAFTSNYIGGTLSAFPVFEDGSLGTLSAQFTPDNSHTGNASHIHCATVSPDGKYIFVNDLGGDAIYRFTVGDRRTAAQYHKSLAVRH